MCGEDFEEYFDEDSDKWKLRDCVKIRAQVRRRGEMMIMGINRCPLQMCHENCIPDLSILEQSIMEVSTNHISIIYHEVVQRLKEITPYFI